VDINPLLASPDRLLVLDARIVLHPPNVSDEDLPRPAIRPYPAQYVSEWTMRDGTEVIIRPIRPEDEPLMVQFHQTLSERSVFLRYFRVETLDRRVAHERLTRICFIDYDREMALVAQLRGPGGQLGEIAGVGRLSKLHSRNAAEFAVLVSDRWQRRGLGRELLRRLIQVGRDEKLERITASVLPENREMQAVMAQLGFRFWMEADDRMLAAELRLR
jgi:acetyltransferase